MSLLEPRPVVFTAQSKLHYYCRDAVCEFVFRHGAIPINPFRAFGYFLDDRVERDLVRQANNNLLRRADALWVFGAEIADGVLFEVRYARELGKAIRYFTIDSHAETIRPLDPQELRFEAEVHEATGLTREQLLASIHGEPPTSAESASSRPRLTET